MSSAIASSLWSQATPSGDSEEEGDDLIQLSPFVVTEDESVGYAATSTLAGTRIKTELKDLGAAISVVTPEFMEDTGATNVEELFAYTTNTEVGGLQGNFSAADLGANSQRYNLDEQRREPQSGTRIRGLSRPNFTRDYFSTSIPIDAYNTGQITMNRGANSLLFGLGSAAGVVNAGLRRTVLSKNSGQVGFRFDQEGSYRAWVDYNQMIIPKRVAVRVDALAKEDVYKQDPAFDREKRAYIAMDAILLENENSRIFGPTTLRASYEIGAGKRTPPSALPPQLAWDSFFSPPPDFRPYTGTDYLQTYDWLAANWTKWRTVDTRRVEDPPGSGNYRPGWFESPATAQEFGHPELLMPVYSTPHVFTQLALVYAQPGAPTIGIPGEDFAAFQGWIPASRQAHSPHINTRMYVEGPQGTGFKGRSLTNTDVFDFRNKLFTGDLQKINRDFDATLVTLEQQLFDGRGGLELTWGDESYYIDYFQPYGGSGRNLPIYIDTSEYLFDGTPNPNVGRAFVLGQGDQFRWRKTERENRRLLAFYDLDFGDLSSGLGRWFGRHVFTGLLQSEDRTITGLNRKYHWQGVDFNWNQEIWNRNNTNWTAFANQVVTMAYVSGDLRGVEEDDVRLNPVQIDPMFDKATYPVKYYNSQTGTVETGTGITHLMTVGGTAGRMVVKSKALAWQPYLLDEHIVGLFGWRKDTIDNYRQVRTNARSKTNEYLPENLELQDEPATTQEGSTFTWSVVGHVPRAWMEKVPFFSSISAHYGEAENFQTVAERHDIFNNPIPNPTGTTKEIGATFSWSDNKWYLKINRFETATKYESVLGGETSNAVSWIRAWLERYQVGADDQTTYPIEEQVVYKVAGYTSYDQVLTAIKNLMPEPARSIYNYQLVNGEWQASDSIRGLSSTSDVDSEGWELELTGNPTSNWRVTANVVKVQTVRSNTGEALKRYSDMVVENLAAAGLTDVPEGVQSITPFIQRWSQQVVTGLAGARAKDGTVSQEAREWRVNLVTNYNFREGGLKGFGVGGAVRWQSEVTTGYAVAFDEFGNQIPDLSRPFRGPSAFNGDLWISYSRKLGEKVNWKIQLNVRNLIGSQDLVPVFTNPDGQDAIFRLPPVRNIFLTNTFSF